MFGNRMIPGMAHNPKLYSETDNYLEYVIDTDLPSTPPIAEGDADLWARMQNMYFAVVKITRQYRVEGDPKNIYYDEYDMTIHFDMLIPYNRLAPTIQQFIQQIIGPANRIFGNVKVYRKTKKYVPKEGWTIVMSNDAMNVYQKL